MRVQIQDWWVKIQTHSPVWQDFFPPLTDPFYIFGQLFSDLASENTELLAKLASVLKNLSTPLQRIIMYLQCKCAVFICACSTAFIHKSRHVSCKNACKKKSPDCSYASFIYFFNYITFFFFLFFSYTADTVPTLDCQESGIFDRCPWSVWQTTGSGRWKKIFWTS
jgi:hypothetical protein